MESAQVTMVRLFGSPSAIDHCSFALNLVPTAQSATILTLLHVGYAMKDSSPAYLLSCVVEGMSWRANLRQAALLQTLFHALTTELT
jgi:hypothetical protein